MSATDEVKERRESNTPINLTKGHTMLKYNKESLHLLNSFVIARVPLILVIYVNRIRH